MSTFDQRTVIEAILYIMAKAGRPVTKYKIVKILYFADLLHLRRYGRTITGDWYAAMEFGPVPSDSYDMIKPVWDPVKPDEAGILQVLQRADQYSALPRRNADIDYLSESERECLDEIASRILPLSFDEIMNMSHGSAWNKGREVAQSRNAKASKILTEWIIEELGEEVARELQSDEAGETWVAELTLYLNEYS